MDPITASVVAARSAAFSWSVGHTLYIIIQSTKVVSQTVRDLQMSIIHLGDVCDTMAQQLQHFDGSTDRNELQSVEGIRGLLTECNTLMERLEKLIEGVRKDHSSFVAQAFRQFRLDLNETEIKICREHIESNISKLNFHLLILVLREVRHTKPASDLVLNAVDKRDTRISHWRHNVEPQLMHNGAGSSTHESTLVGDSVTGHLAVGDSKLDQFKTAANRFRASSEFSDDSELSRIRNSTEAAVPPIVADINTSSRAGSWNEAASIRSVLERDSGDGFLFEDGGNDPAAQSAKDTLSAGLMKFQAGVYAEAQKLLRKAVTEIHELNTQHPQRFISLAGVQYKLAICAFHLGGGPKAEEALIETFARQHLSRNEAYENCSAGHLLALIYAKTDRIDLAAATCESVYLKRRKIFGADHRTSQESLALLAICFEMLGDAGRVESCLQQIPPRAQERLRLEVLQSLHFPHRKAVKDAKIDFVLGKPRSLCWSADNTALAWQYTDFNVCVYATASGHRDDVASATHVINSFALSPSGSHVVVASASTNTFFRDTPILNLYKVKSSQHVRKVKSRYARANITGITFSPDEKLIAYADGTHSVEISSIYAEDGHAIRKPSIKARDQRGSLRFSPSGEELLVFHKKGLTISKPTSFDVAQLVEHDAGNVAGKVAYSPDESEMAFTIYSNKAILLKFSRKRTIERREVMELPYPAYLTTSDDDHDITFLPDGRLIIACYLNAGPNKGLSFYDTRRGTRHVLDDDAIGFQQLAFSRDGTLLAAVAKSGAFIKIWDIMKVVIAASLS